MPSVIMVNVIMLIVMVSLTLLSSFNQSPYPAGPRPPRTAATSSPPAARLGSAGEK